MRPNRLRDIVKAKKALIFDLFHTLTSLESTGTARPRTADILGVPWDRWYQQLADTADDRFVGKIRDPLEITRRLAHAIDPTVGEDRIREATAYRIDRFKGALVNIPAVTEQTLVALRVMGKKIGLVSNADVVETAGWSDSPIATLFDSVIFSCEVGHVKPQREIYDLALAQLGLGAEACLFVGDGGSRELEGARNAGLATVMVTGHIKRIYPEKIAERRTHADFVIDSLGELVAP